jgi:ribonuclease P protein subunit POP4
MIMREAKNIIQHELIGLDCTVVAAKNAASVGISGVIEDETLKTLVINGKTVFKKGSTFRLTLGKKMLEVDGDNLVARPEDRIKKKIKRW